MQTSSTWLRFKENFRFTAQLKESQVSQGCRSALRHASNLTPTRSSKSISYPFGYQELGYPAAFEN